jgi:lipid II:glycine glycyltransferase (peptidoglycan interpeptide bridge formation enzyme)
MKLVAVSDKKLIGNFLELAAPKSGADFLVSAEWADLLKSEGDWVETLGVYNGEELVGLFNLIKKTIKFGYFYYLPRGPIFKQNLNQEQQGEIWQWLSVEFKKQGAIFYRVEPVEKLPANINVQKTINLQPQTTLILDLSLDLDGLLASFHHKTRYNIRLAEKKGITVRESSSSQDIANFWTLMTKTGERDAFKIHNQKHYNALATYNPEFIKLFLAEYNGQVLAAGLFSFYGNKVTYLHGASDHNFRQLMAPYLLQWTLIKLAYDKNYKYYDFYGIDAKKWPGVTRFKLGFSGSEITYAGTQDLVLNRPKYLLYNLLRTLRRFL